MIIFDNFNAKLFLLLRIIPIIIFIIITNTSCTTSEQEKPNIIVILADDMGYSDIGCYGGEIRTPNLDRMAQNGLRFTQFYNTARCCPTRASILTGLYPHQAGMGHMTEDRALPGYTGGLNKQCVTIAEVLKQADYSTYMAGKWHVTKHMGQWTGDSQTSKHNWPLQRGFDRFWGTIVGAGSFYDPATLTDGNTPTEPQKELFYYTDEISSHTVQYIEEHQSNNPFFIYVAYTAPHWPLHALEEDIQKYLGRYDVGWDVIRDERLQRMREKGIVQPGWKLTDRDQSVQSWDSIEDKVMQSYRMAVYAAQVDRMDQGIGRIVKALDEKGEADNTLILFLADNGGCAETLTEYWKGIFIPELTRNGDSIMLGNNHPDLMPGPEITYQSYSVPWANVSNTPFRLYKHWVHEGGIATPLIAFWPGKISNVGTLDHQPGHLIDIMATCVDLGGAEYPVEFKNQQIVPMEGVSLAPAFEGKQLNRKDPIFWEHEGNRAIRTGKWKLVSRVKRNTRFTEGDKDQWELYDLEADRTEMNNLAEEYPERVREMTSQWEKWAVRANVTPWPWDADN
jgi:arylsulfatase